MLRSENGKLLGAQGPSSYSGDIGSKKPDSESVGATEHEVLLWAGDDVEGGRAVKFPRVYDTLMLWDAIITLVVCGPCVAFVMIGILLIVQPTGWERTVFGLLAHPYVIFGGPPALGILTVMAFMPQRVIREIDSLVFEFAFHRQVVPLGEVRELAALDSGKHHFVALMKRTGTFPFGTNIRCFCGVPSGDGVMFVLLSERCFWSFVFCLRDPVQFLVDNQRPLDLRATYRTTGNVKVRKGESLKSTEVGTVRPGRLLRVEEQRGRRILVQFEGSDTRGWMSYVNQLGRFLLSKEERDSSAALCPAPGTVGASELARSYGTAIEMHSVQLGAEGE